MKRRTIAFIVFPVILFIWMIGWSLCWIGDNKTRKENSMKKETLDIHIVTEMIESQVNL